MRDIKRIHMKEHGLENHDLEIIILKEPIPLSSTEESQQKYIRHILEKKCDCIATLKNQTETDNWSVTQAYFSKGKFLFATITHPLELASISEEERYINCLCDFKKIIERHFANEDRTVSYSRFSQTIRDAKIPNKYKESIKEIYDTTTIHLKPTNF